MPSLAFSFHPARQLPAGQMQNPVFEHTESTCRPSAKSSARASVTTSLRMRSLLADSGKSPGLRGYSRSGCVTMHNHLADDFAETTATAGVREKWGVLKDYVLKGLFRKLAVSVLPLQTS